VPESAGQRIAIRALGAMLAGLAVDYAGSNLHGIGVPAIDVTADGAHATIELPTGDAIHVAVVWLGDREARHDG
jgi:hypothetical protein